jgi:hypothetical protein
VKKAEVVGWLVILVLLAGVIVLLVAIMALR